MHIPTGLSLQSYLPVSKFSFLHLACISQLREMTDCLNNKGPIKSNRPRSFFTTGACNNNVYNLSLTATGVYYYIIAGIL